MPSNSFLRSVGILNVNCVSFFIGTRQVSLTGESAPFDCKLTIVKCYAILCTAMQCILRGTE